MNEALRFDRGWLRARVLPADPRALAVRVCDRGAQRFAPRRGLAAARRPGGCGCGRAARRRARRRSPALARSFARPAGQPAALVVAARGIATAADGTADRGAAGVLRGAPRLRSRCCAGTAAEMRRYRGRLYALPAASRAPGAVAADRRRLGLARAGARAVRVSSRARPGACAAAEAWTIRFRSGRREPAAARGPAAQAPQGPVPGSGRRALDARAAAARLRGRSPCRGRRPLDRRGSRRAHPARPRSRRSGAVARDSIDSDVNASLSGALRT